MKLFIPTMPRPKLQDPFEYLRKSLAVNSKFFHRFSAVFLYASESDFGLLQPLADQYKLTLVARPIHHQNKEEVFQRRWEYNLFLDFITCGNLAEGCDFMWLEDDAVFCHEMGAAEFNASPEVTGDGTTCVFILGHDFARVKSILLEKYTDLPLDWAIDRVGCNRSRKLVDHIGKHSTNGCVRTAKKI